MNVSTFFWYTMYYKVIYAFELRLCFLSLIHKTCFLSWTSFNVGLQQTSFERAIARQQSVDLSFLLTLYNYNVYEPKWMQIQSISIKLGISINAIHSISVKLGIGIYSTLSGFFWLTLYRYASTTYRCEVRH